MSRRRPILWHRVAILIAAIVAFEFVSNWLFGGGLWQAYCALVNYAMWGP